MFHDTATLKTELAGYASAHSKLTRMVKSGAWIRIRRGLYLDATTPGVSPLNLAGILCGPSYVSFEYALSYHSLIPEEVRTITCASFHKNKHKTFDTPIGRFTYMSLPDQVYPLAVMLQEENGAGFLIATPEKALCDQLYKQGSLNSLRALEALLFDDLRLEKGDLLALDRGLIRTLAPLYRRTCLRLFSSWIDKEAAHA